MASARLGELLLRARVISPEQLAEANAHSERTGVRLGQILVDRGWVNEKSLYDALARAAGLPRLDMKNVEVDRTAIEHVDSIWALDHGMVPLKLNIATRAIQVAVTDPTNVEPLDELSFRTGLRVQSWLGSEAEIGRLIRHQFFEEPLTDGVPPDRRPTEIAGGPTIEHGMDAVFEQLIQRPGQDQVPAPAPAPAPPPAPESGPPQIGEIFEGHQDNARTLQAIFELCVRRGIITREEYLERLRTAPD